MKKGYVHHNGGQINRREAADFLVIVDIQDLSANLILGPPFEKLERSCTEKIL